MNRKIYIFGAGLSGCVLARLWAENNCDVELIEIKNHIGGNCFDYKDSDGILIHKYGPHIFHTSYDDVWNFLNKFAYFNNYKNKVKVKIDSINKLVSFPINFTSIKEMYNQKKAKDIIKKLNINFVGKKNITIQELLDIQDQDLKDFSNFIFENIYKNYTTKMWGIDPKDIDPNILKRVKINLNYDDNYFPNDKYQGLPINGYTDLLQKIINHKNINLTLNYDFKNNFKITNNKVYLNGQLIDDLIFYSGSIDELFDFVYGTLSYRSLNIEFERHNLNHFQTVGVVNYPSHKTMTRITEYKYLNMRNDGDFTTISKEFPGEWDPNSNEFYDRYYPINNSNNLDIYNKYLSLCKDCSIIPIGRLGKYKYFDMDDCIKDIFEIFETYKQ